MVLRGGPSPCTPLCGPPLDFCTGCFSLWFCSEFSPTTYDLDPGPSVHWLRSLLQSPSPRHCPVRTAAASLQSGHPEAAAAAAAVELWLYSVSLRTWMFAEYEACGWMQACAGTASHWSDYSLERTSALLLFSSCGPAGGPESPCIIWKHQKDKIDSHS